MTLSKPLAGRQCLTSELIWLSSVKKLSRIPPRVLAEDRVNEAKGPFHLDLIQDLNSFKQFGKD